MQLDIRQRIRLYILYGVVDPFVSLAQVVQGMRIEPFVDAFSFKPGLTVAEAMIPYRQRSIPASCSTSRERKGEVISDSH